MKKVSFFDIWPMVNLKNFRQYSCVRSRMGLLMRSVKLYDERMRELANGVARVS